MSGARARGPTPAADDGTRPGRVVGSHGRHLVVEDDDRTPVHAHVRGKRNDAVVGDRVRWRPSGDGGVVERIEERQNLLFRQDEWRSKSFAANLDGVLVLLAGEPMFGESQLARALIAAAHAGIPAVVGLNKTDLAAADVARARLESYVAMGVPVIELALKADPEGARARLDPWLRGRTTLVLGPSGSGKSTLINRMVPDAEAQVGELSRALRSGRHTTTTTRWYWLGPEPDAGALIDSPGFQAFGLQHVPTAALASLMPDLASELEAGCRFHNCTHHHEPGCAIRAAVEAGRIAQVRYRLYLEILDELTAAPSY